MLSIDTHSFRVAVYRKHASYNAKFESAKAELREILIDHQLDHSWLSLEVKKVVEISGRARGLEYYKNVPESLWDTLTLKGILLSRFEESNLKSELENKIGLAENSGLQTLKGLTLPAQIDDIRYLDDSKDYLRSVERSIGDSFKEKERQDYFLKAYGVTPKQFFSSLVRGTNFELDYAFVENGQTHFYLNISDQQGKRVISNKVNFNLDTKTMTVLETDSGYEWGNKGAGRILVRNLLETARLVGMEKVRLGGGGNNGGRFWALFGAEISDVSMKHDSDMLGFPIGMPYYGLQDSSYGIKTQYNFFSAHCYKNNPTIQNILGDYDNRVANLTLSNVNQLVWDLAADRRTVFLDSGATTQFGRLFFKETGLRFSYEFNLKSEECWKRIYKYCDYFDKIKS